MPQDSSPAAIPAPDLPLSQPPPPPGLLELFVAFAKMSLAGFGGVAAFAGLARSAGGDRDYSTLVWTFALMSLFAIGGANLAIPENASARGRRSALDERPAIRRYLFPSFPRDRMC